MRKIKEIGFLEETRAAIADSTIGFVTISLVDGIEDAHPAGSGVLVSVGSVNGILTAAHVLENLPEEGEVGLVCFARRPSVALRQTIDVGFAEKLIIGSRPWRAEGPDLGFLKLSSSDVGALKARNVFQNLGMKQEPVLASIQPDLPYFDGISGMIAEWVSDLPVEQGFSRVKNFGAMFGIGRIVNEHESECFDLCDFEVTYGPESESPNSFGGMSGGALWRIFFTDANERRSVVEKRLIGVAFFESDIVDQRRTITCHGPRSIYGHLIAAIHSRWPD